MAEYHEPYTDEYRALVLEEYRKSGRTAYSFCHSNGMNYQTFKKWLERSQTECTQELNLVRIQDEKPCHQDRDITHSPIRLSCGMFCLEFPNGALEEELMSAVRVLKDTCTNVL